MLGKRISHFIKKIYSQEYTEKDCRQFISYVEDLLSAVKGYTKKGTLFPELMFKIMDRLEAKAQGIRPG